MRRETKFGLGVLGTLAVALGGIVAVRVGKPPIAIEGGSDQETRAALAALEESRAKVSGSEEKPALFSMSEAKFKEPSSAASDSQSSPATTEAPAHHGHSRYAIQPVTPPAEPKTDDSAPTAFDPFQQGGQGAGQIPAATPPGANDPQATLSDGIAPLTPPVVVEAPSQGTSPLTEPAMLTHAPGGVQLSPSPDTLTGRPAALDPNAAAAMQTAGMADSSPSSRYADYRTNPSTHPSSTHQPSTQPPSAHAPSGWDRYNPQPAHATPGHGATSGFGTPAHGTPPHSSTTMPHATIGGNTPGHRAPQYDVYGRDISGERDDPPPEAPTSPPPMQHPTDLLGRRLDDAPPVEHHHVHQGDTYTVAPNDNYWSISQKVYGNGGYFKAIEEHNRDRYPYSENLRANDVVSVPDVKTLEKKYPDLCPKQRQSAPGHASGLLTSSHGGIPGGRVYKVREGDTLFDIARNELGKASRWADIYELNRDRLGNDFDFLAPGMELMLPGSRTQADPLTTQSHPLQTR